MFLEAFRIFPIALMNSSSEDPFQEILLLQSGGDLPLQLHSLRFSGTEMSPHPQGQKTTELETLTGNFEMLRDDPEQMEGQGGRKSQRVDPVLRSIVRVRSTGEEEEGRSRFL